MKLASLPALLSCIVLAAPLGAQAAMDKATSAKFTEECVTTAKGQQVDAQKAKAHCDCGAAQINKNFSDAEIAELNSRSTPPKAALTNKLQTLIAQNCVGK